MSSFREFTDAVSRDIKKEIRLGKFDIIIFMAGKGEIDPDIIFFQNGLLVSTEAVELPQLFVNAAFSSLRKAGVRVTDRRFRRVLTEGDSSLGTVFATVEDTIKALGEGDIFEDLALTI